MSVPVDDRRVLHLARQAIIYGRGWTTGFLVRDLYRQACRRGGFSPRMAELGATASWTAALKRLVRAGELKRVELVNQRTGKPSGFGFDLADSWREGDTRTR